MNETDYGTFARRTPRTILPFRTGHYTYHEGRAQFMEFLAGKVAAHTAGPVLDVGCGAGYFLRALEARRVPAAGFDVSDEAIDLARRNARTKVLRHDANERWPFPDGRFGAVTMFDVLEHFAAYDYVLSETYRTLRPGGSVFVVTVNRTSVLRWILGERWGGAQDPDHVTLFDGKRLKSALRSAGLAIREYKTFFNLGVAGETVDALALFRRPGRILYTPALGDSMYARARKPS